jgi:hypothetical protein
MSRISQYVVAVLYTAVLTSQVEAQTVRTQIPVVTRLVQIYSDYEQRLADAIIRKDTGEINRLIADDFELRPADNIGVPTPRAEWIAQSLKEPSASISIAQMAVHDYGNIRIVSFAMKRTADTRQARGVAAIDVWMLSGESSVLKVRYSAIQRSPSIPVPGESQPQQIKKRY